MLQCCHQNLILVTD